MRIDRKGEVGSNNKLGSWNPEGLGLNWEKKSYYLRPGMWDLHAPKNIIKLGNDIT